MKKQIAGWMMLSFLLATFPALSYAEVFQSEVKSAGGNEFVMVRKDPVTGTVNLEEQHVRVSKRTKFSNLENLSDLRPGDEVEVDGKWNRKKAYWDAKSLSVAKVKISDDTKKN